MPLRVEQLVPPPPRNNLPSADWGRVESQLGLRLPPDYKAFASLYGPGWIDDFLCIFHPSTRSPHLDLLVQINEKLNALRLLRSDGYETIPYPIFPEPGGVLPWGDTENGDVCYWRVLDADPTKWDVVVNESRAPEWFHFPGTLTDFLAAVLAHEIEVPMFPQDFPSEDLRFDPRD